MLTHKHFVNLDSLLVLKAFNFTITTFNNVLRTYMHTNSIVCTFVCNVITICMMGRLLFNIVEHSVIVCARVCNCV